MKQLLQVLILEICVCIDGKIWIIMTLLEVILAMSIDDKKYIYLLFQKFCF